MSIVYNGVGTRGKKPPISDTVKGAEGGEERKELELED
jgi:hypothetical protein